MTDRETCILVFSYLVNSPAPKLLVHKFEGES